MPKKRRKQHNRPRGPAHGTARATGRPEEPRVDAETRPGTDPEALRTRPARPRGGGRGQADPAARSRAEKKEIARRQREDVRRRVRRRNAVRRALQIGVISAVVVGAVLFFTRAQAPADIPQSAIRAAGAASCGDVQTPAGSAPGGLHLAQGEPFTYEQHPATSGSHAPAPLPAEPHVYTTPVDETAAVHNLEHAYVLIYYRADGPEALPTEVVDELATLAESEDKVIMAPYDSLEEGTSLALAAWNKLWECPAGVTAVQARAIASGFIEAFRGSSNAPEPNAG
jgi:Protein of unknown function (DUF3105)